MYDITFNKTKLSEALKYNSTPISNPLFAITLALSCTLLSSNFLSSYYAFLNILLSRLVTAFLSFTTSINHSDLYAVRSD